MIFVMFHAHPPHATAWRPERRPSAKRTTARRARPVAGLSFRKVAFGLGGNESLEDNEDGPAVDRTLQDRSADPSNCQSMPCCFLSCAKDSRRASMSSFDLSIFSGWWYSTTKTVSNDGQATRRFNVGT